MVVRVFYMYVDPDQGGGIASYRCPSTQAKREGAFAFYGVFFASEWKDLGTRLDEGVTGTRRGEQVPAPWSHADAETTELADQKSLNE